MQKYFWAWSEIPPSLYELTSPQIRNICGHQVHELSKLKYVAFRRDLESDRKILWLVVAREKRTELTALVLNWLWPCPLVPKIMTTQTGLWEEAGCVGESTRIEIRRTCSQSWGCGTRQFSQFPYPKLIGRAVRFKGVFSKWSYVILSWFWKLGQAASEKEGMLWLISLLMHSSHQLLEEGCLKRQH